MVFCKQSFVNTRISLAFSYDIIQQDIMFQKKFSVTLLLTHKVMYEGKHAA